MFMRVRFVTYHLFSVIFNMQPSLKPNINFSDFINFLGLNQKANQLAFNRKVKKFFNKKHITTFKNCSSGIFNILKSNKITNQNVLITSYTCSVVTEAIVKSNNKPYLVDIKKNSINADIINFLKKNKKKVFGAIIFTNLYGIDDLKRLKKLNIKKNCIWILDNALSPQATKNCSNMFDYIAISTNIRKPFSCLGGGLVFSSKNKNFNILDKFTNQNRLKRTILDNFKEFLLIFSLFLSFTNFFYSIVSIIRRKTFFLNYFFDEKNNKIKKPDNSYYKDMSIFSKRVGCGQINKLSSSLKKRIKIGNIYYELLVKKYSWVKNFWLKNTPYSHISFLHKNRNKLEKYLYKHSIETEKYFDYNISDLKQYKIKNNYPRSSNISKSIINLPIHEKLNFFEIQRICKLIYLFDKKKFD